jgi:hypothetical protein
VWLFAGIHLGSAFFGWEEPIENLVMNLIVATLVGILLEFLFFRVDYSKTEYLQFADNEYYYYIKAIPKRFSEDWNKKQEAARRREEREKEEERQKRRTELKHRDDEDLRGKEPLGADSRRSREIRGNQEEDRPPGRRFSGILPPANRLSRKKEDEPQENLGETTVIDAGQVNDVEKSRPGLRNNQTNGSNQGSKNNQMNGIQGKRNNQTAGNNKTAANKQAGDKRTDLDKSLGLEPSKDSGDNLKKETYNRSKKKNRGGKRRDSR